MQTAKVAMPEAKSISIVYGSDDAMRASGFACLEAAKKAGLCVTGFYEANFFSTNYSSIVDGVLEQVAKGVYQIYSFTRIVVALILFVRLSYTE